MNVFAYLGDDELRKQEALEAAVENWQGKDSAGPDASCMRETYFGDDLRWEQVAEAFQTQDLFAARKTIVIKNWDKLHAASQKHLEAIFREDNSTVAVFIMAEKWDGRNALRKALTAANQCFEFKTPYEDKIPQWIAQRARDKYQRRVNLIDAQLLLDIVGKNLSDLDHELEKLDTFLPAKAPINAVDIHDLVSPLKVAGIFEFQKTMGLRIKPDLLPTLRNLLENEYKDAPFVIAQMLYTHFLSLAKISAALDEGQNEASIIPILKRPPFIIQKERYFEQAKTRTTETWKKLLARLAKLETELKQGRYPHRFEVEMAFAAMV